VILLAVYAAAVCLLTAKHRRGPLGYAIAVLGALFPLLVLQVIKHIVPPSEGTSPTGGDDVSPLSLNMIMMAESAFLLVMGLFLASLPRPHPAGFICRRCGYHLSGLDPMGLDCPECGEHWSGPGSADAAKQVARIPIPTGPVKRRRPM
jgi:hypothetical protein